MDDWEARMADKARLRALERQLGDRTEAQRWFEVQNSQLMARVRAVTVFLEGPEHDCEYCFTFQRHFKFGNWAWEHRWSGETVVETGEHSAICSHECHGPDGYELNAVALAAC